MPSKWTGEELHRLHKSGGGRLTWRQLGEHTGMTRCQARERVRRYLKGQGTPRRDTTDAGPASFDTEARQKLYNGIQASEIIAILRGAALSIRQLSEQFDRSEVTMSAAISAMIADGYGITCDERLCTMPVTPPVSFEPTLLFPSRAETFEAALLLVSDTHGGSKFEQPSALADIVHVAREEYGVEHAIHAGDVFAGRNVYRGQENDIYAVTGEEQADAVANNLPGGVKWHILGGNHDYSFYRQVGLDARNVLAVLRDDVVLLPFDAAEVPLFQGKSSLVSLYAWHPMGGVPYAISYRAQKGVERLSYAELMKVIFKEKPAPSIRIVLAGHLHLLYEFRSGPIAVFGAGCFEGQNSFLKRKMLFPEIGGWVVKCRFVDGILYRLQMEQLGYCEIEDDWRPRWSARQAKREVRRMEPIFSYREGAEN